jgi:hypothetical protein
LYNILREKNFKNQNDAKNAFQEFVASRSNAFYADGIKQLVSRWQKCIDANGSYFD